MKALFDAIFAQWLAAGAPLSLLALFNTEADDRTEFPYGVVQVVSGTPTDHATGAHYSESWLIQFNLFDKTPDMSSLLEKYAALTAAFDFATLTIAGYTFLSCVRETTLQTRVEDVFQINVIYRVTARVL